MRSLTVGDEENNEFFARFVDNNNDDVEDMGENDPHDFDAEDAYMAFDNTDAGLPSYPEVCLCARVCHIVGMNVHLYICHALFQVLVEIV